MREKSNLFNFFFRIQRLPYQSAVQTVCVINWTPMVVHGLKSNVDVPKVQTLAQHLRVSAMVILSLTEVDSTK